MYKIAKEKHVESMFIDVQHLCTLSSRPHHGGVGANAHRCA
jgi:hypothetical protein